MTCAPVSPAPPKASGAPGAAESAFGVVILGAAGAVRSTSMETRSLVAERCDEKSATWVAVTV